MQIALLGCGTVGLGVYDIVASRATPQLGELTVKRILERPQAGCTLPGVTFDFADIENDPEIEVVVEAMGGLHPAYEYIMASLRAKKHVVTSNKAVLAHHFDDFMACAAENGVRISFEAAVAGGIPWISALKKAARIDPMDRFSGIVNGTTNYILHQLTELGKAFSAVLAEAQKLGYAELDPSADIDGEDARNKCIVTAGVAFGCAPAPGDVPTFGIRHITAEDVATFRAWGLCCKLIAEGRRGPGGIYLSVEPVLFPRDALEASVPRNFNLVTLYGATVGELKFYGQGAGSMPTGNAVVQDLLDLALPELPGMPRTSCRQDCSLLQGAHYLRMRATCQKQAIELLGDMLDSCERRNDSIILCTHRGSAHAFYEKRAQLQQLDPALFSARFH